MNTERKWLKLESLIREEEVETLELESLKFIKKKKKLESLKREEEVETRKLEQRESVFRL